MSTEEYNVYVLGNGNEVSVWVQWWGDLFMCNISIWGAIISLQCMSFSSLGDFTAFSSLSTNGKAAKSPSDGNDILSRQIMLNPTEKVKSSIHLNRDWNHWVGTIHMGSYIRNPVGLGLEALLTYQRLVPLKGLNKLVLSCLSLDSWRPLIPSMQWTDLQSTAIWLGILMSIPLLPGYHCYHSSELLI